MHADLQMYDLHHAGGFTHVSRCYFNGMKQQLEMSVFVGQVINKRVLELHTGTKEPSGFSNP